MPLPHMNRPVDPAEPFPPHGFASHVEVSAGTNWASVTPPGRTASELIFYNFGTYVSREVNWYLWHYLGRTELAGDGINLTFGTDPSNPSIASNPFEKFKAGDKPYLYLPPASWIAPSVADELLRSDVLAVLQGPGITHNYFRFTAPAGSYFLGPGDLAFVRETIRRRLIPVHYDPTLSSDGKYVFPNSASKANTLRLKFSRATGPFHRALIVHESVHAACDLKSVRMPSRIAENLAYVAQAYHLYSNGVYPGSAPSEKDLLEAAGLVAIRVQNGVREYTAADCVPLGSAIASRYPAGVYSFDGL